MRRWRLLAVLTAAFLFWPLVPSRQWSLIPYTVCGWLHAERDQWQCDD